ncbi:MAG: Signal peptidase [Ignavibacteria bacterium]|nr:Signal peptidase [Ignavibacteria bacterium]
MENKLIKWYKDKKAHPKPPPQTFGEKLWSWLKTIVGAIVVVMIINGLAIASFVVPTPSMERTVMTGDFLFVNKFVYGPSTPQVVPFFNVPLPFFRFPGIKDPKQGDVIVFIFPGNRDEVESKEFQYYLKRCVASAGDTLLVRDNRVFVNGNEFIMPKHALYDSTMPVTPSDKWGTFPPGRDYTRENYGPLRIPKKGDVIHLNQQNFREWYIFITREGHHVSSDGNVILIDDKPATTYTVQRNYCFGMGDNRDHSLDSRYWGFIPFENVVGTPIVVYWSWNTDLSLSKLVDKLKSVRWSRLGTFIN